ncbi:hypothetical protein [Blastococcus sp. SYSU DS0617]
MSTGSTARPVPARSSAPWDVSFLRVGTLLTLAVAAVAALVAGLVAGWEHAAAIGLSAVIVTAFFAVSGLAVAFAGRIGDTLTLPAALLAFFVKAIVLFAVLDALPADGWLDRRTVAWAVVVGALLWSGIQLRWVWTRQIFYVPPPVPPSGSSDQVVAREPGSTGKAG